MILLLQDNAYSTQVREDEGDVDVILYYSSIGNNFS